MTDVDDELEPVTLGRNFGINIDIEINPYDGKIYVVNLQLKNGRFIAYPLIPKGKSILVKLNTVYGF